MYLILYIHALNTLKNQERGLEGVNKPWWELKKKKLEMTWQGNIYKNDEFVRYKYKIIK